MKKINAPAPPASAIVPAAAATIIPVGVPSVPEVSSLVLTDAFSSDVSFFDSAEGEESSFAVSCISSVSSTGMFVSGDVISGAALISVSVVRSSVSTGAVRYPLLYLLQQVSDISGLSGKGSRIPSADTIIDNNMVMQIMIGNNFLKCINPS